MTRQRNPDVTMATFKAQVVPVRAQAGKSLKGKRRLGCLG
jgi:hypothetical protein